MLRTIKRIGLTALIIATGFALIFVLLIFLSINRFPETSLKYIDDYLLASFDINYEKIEYFDTIGYFFAVINKILNIKNSKINFKI